MSERPEQIERPGMHRKFLTAGKEAKAAQEGLSALGVPYQTQVWPGGIVEIYWPPGHDTGKVFPPTIWSYPATAPDGASQKPVSPSPGAYEDEQKKETE